MVEIIHPAQFRLDELTSRVSEGAAPSDAAADAYAALADQQRRVAEVQDERLADKEMIIALLVQRLTGSG